MKAIYAHTIKMARALPGLFFFFTFVIFGSIGNHYLNTPFPDVIIGMIVFLVFLLVYSSIFKKLPGFITYASEYFLPLLPLFILPSCIGILDHFNLIKEEAWVILISLTIGIVVTQLITPFVLLFALKIFHGQKS